MKRPIPDPLIDEIEVWKAKCNYLEAENKSLREQNKAENELSSKTIYYQAAEIVAMNEACGRYKAALEEIAYGEFSHQYETDIAKQALGEKE